MLESVAMICPECKAEYRRGFTRCADCDVDLVEELRVKPSPWLEQEQPQSLADGNDDLEGVELGLLVTRDDAIRCAETCLRLREEGIRYRVMQGQSSLGLGMNAPKEFQIWVAKAELGQVRDGLGIQEYHPEDGPVPTEEEIHAAMELPDTGGSEAEENDNWDPENWHPEYATVEVWLEHGKKYTWVVESALQENRISSRTEIDADGTRRILVQPEDEPRAREIVREIKDATMLD